MAVRRAAVLATLEGVTLAPITPSVLARAAQPFPTALLLSDPAALVFATYDAELATAARAMGFTVEGA